MSNELSIGDDCPGCADGTMVESSNGETCHCCECGEDTMQFVNCTPHPTAINSGETFPRHKTVFF